MFKVIRLNLNQRRAMVCLMFLTCFLTSANYVAAEEACEVWTDEALPKIEHTGKVTLRRSKINGEVVREYVFKKGERLDSMAFVWERGVWFHMPLGYFAGYRRRIADIGFGSVDMSHIDTDKEAVRDLLKEELDEDFEKQENYHPQKWYRGYQFAFWMPEIRYLERDTSYMHSLHPCEAGRPKPEVDQYVVKFRINSPYLDEPWRSPDNLWTKNHLARLESWWYKYDFRVSPKVFIDGSEWYHIVDSIDNVHVKLFCSPYIGEKKRPIDTCRGEVWDMGSNLVLNITFPSDQGVQGFAKKWIKPVQATLVLVNEWRQK
ncbi:MAG: hypothetical protein OCD03_03110 [Hyphomicrobiales bacterium]